MVKKLRVDYFPARCVGNGNCAAIAPEQFALVGEKAILKRGKTENGVSFLEGEFHSPEDILAAGQGCPANAIQVTDLETGEVLVSADVNETTLREVVAKYDDATEFVLDPAGYFLVRIDSSAKVIEIGFCNGRNKLVLKVVGTKPLDIYHTIIVHEKLKLRPEHYAYLGRELQKAYIALQKGIAYVQDDELVL
ncbi:TPA: hypothetical protein HA241_07835 [Candidatus Woesearchaeota archaeon]|nr:hypothetical protein [Candidatus Woesearchaeota archaeon]